MTKLSKHEITAFAKQYLAEHGDNLLQSNASNIAYFNTSRGIYTGVTYRHINNNQGEAKDEYYGFYLDFTTGKIMLNSASGNVIKVNTSNLNKVFPSSKAMMESTNRATQMLGTLAYMLERYGNEDPNTGRGLLRAIRNPYAEQFYKDFMIDNEGKLRGPGINYYRQLRPKLLKEWLSSAVYMYYNYSTYQTSWADILITLSSYAKYGKINRKIGSEVGGTYLTKNNPENNESQITTGSLRKDLKLGKGAYNNLRHFSLDALSSWVYPDGTATINLLDWGDVVTKNSLRNKIIDVVNRLYAKSSNIILMEKNKAIDEFSETYVIDDIRSIINLVEQAGKKVDLNKLVEYVLIDVYTRQALGSIHKIVSDLLDYYQMVTAYPNYIKYPKYLSVAHDIASRNFKQKGKEGYNKAIYNHYNNHKHAEGMFLFNKTKFAVIALRSANEVVSEGSSQSNCVGSYSQKVAEGKSYIFSIRKPDKPSDSWITVEVNNNNEIIQAYQTYNQRVAGLALDYLKAWANSVNLTISNHMVGANNDELAQETYKARRTAESVEPYHYTPLTECAEYSNKHVEDETMTYINRL